MTHFDDRVAWNNDAPACATRAWVGHAPTRQLLGSSAAMRKVASVIEQVANRPISVLLHGESGTGKEVVARLLHDKSARADKPFVAINCSAIQDGLIDSELFGHAKGAFTGASADRLGLIVDADGGTIFLDEIGDMPLSVQVRLLRVLQESEVRPVGGTRVRKVDVRVIAASHVDLVQAVADGRFREDLYYRLNVVTIELPPLRARLGDIPALATFFLRKHGGATPPVLSEAALHLLMTISWPGNVRELENALQHAIVFRDGDTIEVSALPAALRGQACAWSRQPASRTDTPIEPMTEARTRMNIAFERAYLCQLLTLTSGSISGAARLSGVDRTSLKRLLKRHEIAAQTYRAI